MEQSSGEQAEQQIDETDMVKACAVERLEQSEQPEHSEQPKEGETTKRVRELGLELEERIISDRRYLHAHPELGFQEFETQKFICNQLDELGIPYEKMAETGVVATLAGQAPGAYDAEGNPAYRLALRADIDALPVQELTGFSYASQNGRMHACGHDCHIAMMLGAARILSQMRACLRGEIRFIFEPAEEITQGAKRMISEGVLEGVDSIFGMHIWSEVEAGTISCPPGQRMANTDWFRIDIEGASCHGSMPHKGTDAIVILGELISELQVLVSRDISPFEPAVVTIGEVHGGTARNIVAGSAYLAGTVRTWSDKTRADLRYRMERLAKDTAEGFGAEAKVAWEEGHGGLSNDAKVARRAEAAVEALFGREALSDYEGTLAGDDFSEYLLHVPGAYAFLGTYNVELDACYPQHSCYYTVDESVLKNGAMLSAQYALDTLR